MRVDDALDQYSKAKSRVSGVRPADPQVVRERLSSLKDIQLGADDTRTYYDAVHHLKDTLQSKENLHQPSSSVWQPVIDHYENEPKSRGTRATYFDVLNFQAWRIYLQNHGLYGIADNDEPFTRILPLIGEKYGTIVVEQAHNLATREKIDEKFISDLDLLWDLLDCPPEVLPHETIVSILEALEPCVKKEHHYFWFFFPIVGFNSTLWMLFSPITIDRALQNINSISIAKIRRSVEEAYQDAESSENIDRIAEKQCTAALLDCVKSAPYEGNKVLIKNLLHFFYPVALSMRYHFDKDYLDDKLEAMNRISADMVWCNEKFIWRLQKAVDELWGLHDVDFGLIVHFCSDLTADAAMLSTQELKEVLIREYGVRGERLYQRFLRSEAHTLFETMARKLDLDFDSVPIGWDHWKKTGYVVSVERNVPYKQLVSGQQSPLEYTSDDPKVDAARESGATLAKSKRKQRREREGDPNWTRVKEMNLDGDFFEVRDRIEKSETEWATIVTAVTNEIKEYLSLVMPQDLTHPFRADLPDIRKRSGSFATTLIARGLVYILSQGRDENSRLNKRQVGQKLGFYWNVSSMESNKSELLKQKTPIPSDSETSEENNSKKRGRPEKSEEEKNARRNLNAFLMEDCLFSKVVITMLVSAGRYSEKELEYLDKI